MYTDSDLIFYLSYYHCLQTVKKSFNKQRLKGHTTVLRFDRFQESCHHDVIGTRCCQSKLNTQWVIHKRFIDGHEHNNGRLGYEQCVEQSSFVCLKMSKHMKREKKIQLTVFLFCCKGRLLSFYQNKSMLNETVNMRNRR